MSASNCIPELIHPECENKNNIFPHGLSPSTNAEKSCFHTQSHGFAIFCSVCRRNPLPKQDLPKCSKTKMFCDLTGKTALWRVAEKLMCQQNCDIKHKMTCGKTSQYSTVSVDLKNLQNLLKSEFPRFTQSGIFQANPAKNHNRQVQITKSESLESQKSAQTIL